MAPCSFFSCWAAVTSSSTSCSGREVKAGGHGARGSHARSAASCACAPAGLPRATRSGWSEERDSRRPAARKRDRRPWHGRDRLALRSASLRHTTRGSAWCRPPSSFADKGASERGAQNADERLRSQPRDLRVSLAGPPPRAPPRTNRMRRAAPRAPAPPPAPSRGNTPQTRTLCPRVFALRQGSAASAAKPPSEQAVPADQAQALPRARRAGCH